MKYYLFVYVNGAPEGGLHDHVETFDTVGEAERFLISDRLHRGWKNRAHVGFIDDGDEMNIASSYEHNRIALDSAGAFIKGTKATSARWIKEIDEDHYLEVKSLYVR